MTGDAAWAEALLDFRRRKDAHFASGKGPIPADALADFHGLSDFAPDGKARKVETFVEGLNIPIGVLPLGTGDSALVHSIPSIHVGMLR